MTRVAVCGAAFASAVASLELDAVDERPDLALVDLTDPEGLARAVAVEATVPRVALASPEHEALLRALGVTSVALARSAHPAALGPLIASAIPAGRRAATRLVLITGRAGGVGRTLLAVNLALRLATRSSVLILDVTGTGAAGWWLRLVPGPWSDLEGLVDELTSEHLAIVAAEQGRLRLVGGASAMPSSPLALAAARASLGVADLVIIDAPPLPDDRTRALAAIADRVLVVAGAAPTSLAPLDGLADDGRVWSIGSREQPGRSGDPATLRCLPDDPASVRAAARGPGAAGGALGRAYDDLAELLSIDAE